MLLNEVVPLQRFVFVDPRAFLTLSDGVHTSRGVFQLLSVFPDAYILDFETTGTVITVSGEMGTRGVLLV